jgi:hypothetical protein
MPLTITRRFTSTSHDVAALFTWEYRECGANEKKKVRCPSD